MEADRAVAALAGMEPDGGDIDKVGLCCHTAPPFLRKRAGPRGSGSFSCQFYKKLLLNAALLAGLAHALEADGAVHQSKQGVIAALADILAGLDVGATLTGPGCCRPERTDHLHALRPDAVPQSHGRSWCCLRPFYVPLYYFLLSR